MESPGAYVTVSFTLPFLLGPVFFRTVLRCCGGYHLERGGMPLDDVVGVNCKKVTTENQGTGRYQIYGLRNQRFGLSNGLVNS